MKNRFLNYSTVFFIKLEENIILHFFTMCGRFLETRKRLHTFLIKTYACILLDCQGVRKCLPTGKRENKCTLAISTLFPRCRDIGRETRNKGNLNSRLHGDLFVCSTNCSNNWRSRARKYRDPGR